MHINNYKTRVMKDISEGIGIYGFLICLYTISAAAGAFSVASLTPNNYLSLKNFIEPAFLSLNGNYSLLNAIFVASLNNLVCIIALNLGKHKKPLLIIGLMSIALNALADGLSSRIMIKIWGIRGFIMSLLIVGLPSILFCLCHFKLFRISAQSSWVHAKRANTNALALSNNNSVNKSAFLFWSLASFVAVLYQTIVAPVIVNVLLKI